MIQTQWLCVLDQKRDPAVVACFAQPAAGTERPTSHPLPRKKYDPNASISKRSRTRCALAHRRAWRCRAVPIAAPLSLRSSRAGSARAEERGTGPQSHLYPLVLVDLSPVASPLATVRGAPAAAPRAAHSRMACVRYVPSVWTVFDISTRSVQHMLRATLSRPAYWHVRGMSRLLLAMHVTPWEHR